MFRVSFFIAILASAAAFAPVGRITTSSGLKMSFESELGAQPPLGFWDPLNLLKDADQERFDRLRYLEKSPMRLPLLTCKCSGPPCNPIRNDFVWRSNPFSPCNVFFYLRLHSL